MDACIVNEIIEMISPMATLCLSLTSPQILAWMVATKRLISPDAWSLLRECHDVLTRMESSDHTGVLYAKDIPPAPYIPSHTGYRHEAYSSIFPKEPLRFKLNLKLCAIIANHLSLPIFCIDATSEFDAILQYAKEWNVTSRGNFTFFAMDNNQTPATLYCTPDYTPTDRFIELFRQGILLITTLPPDSPFISELRGRIGPSRILCLLKPPPLAKPPASTFLDPASAHIITPYDSDDESRIEEYEATCEDDYTGNHINDCGRAEDYGIHKLFSEIFSISGKNHGTELHESLDRKFIL